MYMACRKGRKGREGERATFHVVGKKFRCVIVCVSASLVRVGAQLGLTHMITIEIKIPNRMVGLGKQR